MTRLSVNINKIATLRNARGGNMPDVTRAAQDCERFGAQGITVHPRPDGRHIKYADVREIRPHITTEFNIEGYPAPEFMELVTKIKPAQVTLVPDSPEQITSNHGWNTLNYQDFLVDIISELKRNSIRASVFVDADPRMVELAAKAGADRVELYTEPYASDYIKMGPEYAIKPFVAAAKKARECGMGLNAGHDLSLVNLRYMKEQIPWLDEVSIGHALVCDALYLGLEKTISEYKNCIK